MAMIIEGTIVHKDAGQRLMFEGREHDAVHCTVARLDDPARHAECYVLDRAELVQSEGDVLRIAVLKPITDRRQGVVRFYGTLLEAE
jgi:hypothetical protein